MKKILFIFIIMCYLLSYGNVFDKKSQISSFINEIPKLESISCKFKQEKIVKGVQKPLISGGNFQFIKNKGIYFETTYPIKSTISYTSKEYKQINQIINAISEKKYKSLEKDFDFYFEKEKNNWTLALKPKKDNEISKYITSIRIDGNTNINKIIIIMTNGNKTTQWFLVK